MKATRGAPTIVRAAAAGGHGSYPGLTVAGASPSHPVTARSPRAEQEMTMTARWFPILISMMATAATAIACSPRPATHEAARAVEPTAVPQVAAPADADVVAALAARRAIALDRLRAYRLAAAYPVDADGLPAGVFRDEHGVRCPMSELIFLSGHPALVDDVVRTNNRLRLADVHDGPLLAWMQTSGLTRDEIIAVQGVMELSFGNIEGGNGEALQIVFAAPDGLQRAHAEVTARLVEAEAALQADTQASLAIAAAQLPADARAQVVAGHAATAPAAGQPRISRAIMAAPAATRPAHPRR